MTKALEFMSHTKEKLRNAYDSDVNRAKIDFIKEI